MIKDHEVEETEMFVRETLGGSNLLRGLKDHGVHDAHLALATNIFAT